jgi:hypothetical protein
MSVDLIAGVDCGATKVMVQSGFLCPDSSKIIPGPIHAEYHYSDHPSWDNNFIPVPLDIQQSEYSSNNITLRKGEIEQGNVISKTILESIESIDDHKIGLCFPGLKNENGITVMANGPRIPDLTSRIKKINKIFNDSECCVIGEWKSTIGQMQNLDNGIYIGGGTGIADGVIIDGSLIDLNNIKELPKSWEINIDAKDTVESCLSPAGMIRKHNETNETNIETLVELSNEDSFSNIIDLAIEAFLLLVKNRSQYFEMRKKRIQTIVIGQRLGQFLEHGDPELKERFQKSTDIPIKLSSDRRTAALGAAMLIAC